MQERSRAMDVLKNPADDLPHHGLDHHRLPGWFVDLAEIDGNMGISITAAQLIQQPALNVDGDVDKQGTAPTGYPEWAPRKRRVGWPLLDMDFFFPPAKMLELQDGFRQRAQPGLDQRFADPIADLLTWMLPRIHNLYYNG